MKSSGVAWIREIPFEWKAIPFKSVYSLGKGLNITKADLTETGIPVISYGQIHSKQNTGTSIKDELIRFVPENYLESNKDALVYEGDIIFADTSEDLEGCGNCVYIDRDDTLFAGYHTIIAKHTTTNHSNYLAYLFQTDCWRQQIRSMVNGVKVFSIPQKLLSTTSIIIPPQEEQRKITAFLDKKCNEIDKMVALQEKIIEELKAFKQSIINETVCKGLNPESPMIESGIEWIGLIPKGWGITRVKWLLQERKERSANGEEEPLSMSQKLGLIPTKEMDIVPNMASSYEGAKLVYKGDLVFNKLKAHLGVFSTSNYDGLVSPDYAVYYATGRANVEYLEFLFKTPQCIGEFKKRITGVASGLSRLYTDDLFSIYCPIPPLEEQERIIGFLREKRAEIDTLISLKQSKIEALKEYKKSIIYEYITGKKELNG